MTGATETRMSNKAQQSATLSLLQLWNDWELELMVLTSFVLQLFLLLTGNLRRRRMNILLRVLIWLTYVGADLVAVYAIGLFSEQYERKYKSGRIAFGDTLPFLWVPFLILHLGGQDSITAFSIEDNNLWIRHLLNLGIQVTLALYVFWRSYSMIPSLVLTPATLMFVSGIIKYGERTWALRTGSRDGLGTTSLELSRGITVLEGFPEQDENRKSIHSYARQTTLLARGLFIGRTVVQLGDRGLAGEKIKREFRKYDQPEEKLEIIVMELGMMFDLLYTKTVVLQKWSCVIFRSVSWISMAVAFVLFVGSEKHANNKVNVNISYTLFVGATFMEFLSLCIVLASPWTKVLSLDGSFLYRISSICAWFLSKTIPRNKKQWLSYAIGQYNLMDRAIAERSRPAVIRKVLSWALGLEHRLRILLHTKHIDANGVAMSTVELFGRRQPEEWFGQQLFGQDLNRTLIFPFEQALLRLHIFTDLCISEVCSSADQQVRSLMDDCEKLSNYMIYLIEVYPSMLPISTAVQDIGANLCELVMEHAKNETTRKDILAAYANQLSSSSVFPLEAAQYHDVVSMKETLEAIKEMWVRLLIYAAGKCPGEVHARQLGKGGELLTFVWLLMLHHGLGDATTEVKLLTSDDPDVPPPGSLVSVERHGFGVREALPRHAFEFHVHQASSQQPLPQQDEAGTSSEGAGAGRDGEASSPQPDDEARTSSEGAGRDDDSGTQSEIHEVHQDVAPLDQVEELERTDRSAAEHGAVN